MEPLTVNRPGDSGAKVKRKKKTQRVRDRDSNQISCKKPSYTSPKCPCWRDLISYLACYQGTPDTSQLQFRCGLQTKQKVSFISNINIRNFSNGSLAGATCYVQIALVLEEAMLVC